MSDLLTSYGKPAASPVVLSVSHAGRDYPHDIASRLAVSLLRARSLEDRHADCLAARSIEAGRHVVVARTPRLMIDLNRAETDFDPHGIAGTATLAAHPSALARSGLGLIPDRLGGSVRLWKAPVSAEDLVDRLRAIHRPFHAAVAEALKAAHAVHGWALLVDLHSMPTLDGARPADLVIGDRHGQTASAALVDAIRSVARHSHLRTTMNIPYAGGQIVQRHAEPMRSIFAVQLEFDRRLYLDEALDRPGPGATRLAAVVEAIAEACESAGNDRSVLLAAE